MQISDKFKQLSIYEDVAEYLETKDYESFLDFFDGGFFLKYQIYNVINARTDEFVAYSFEINYIDAEDEVRNLYSSLNEDGKSKFFLENISDVLKKMCEIICTDEKICLHLQHLIENN